MRTIKKTKLKTYGEIVSQTTHGHLLFNNGQNIVVTFVD